MSLPNELLLLQAAFGQASKEAQQAWLALGRSRGGGLIVAVSAQTVVEETARMVAERHGCGVVTYCHGVGWSVNDGRHYPTLEEAVGALNGAGT